MRNDEYTATVIKYVDDEAVDIATGNFKQVVKKLRVEKIEKNVYFKLAAYNDVPYTYVQDIHFGCSCKKRGGLKITQGIYCNAYLNNQFKRYLKDKKGWGPFESFLLLVRFSLYFYEATQLNPKSKYFSEWTKHFFEDKKWLEVKNLNDFNKISGIYALILDEYAKCYIGQSIDIKRRVISHWRTDSFVTQGIDLFRAKDTTRIFVLPLLGNNLDQAEYDKVGAIPDEYRLNFLQGGSIEYHEKTGKDLLFEDSLGESLFGAGAVSHNRMEKEMIHYFEKGHDLCN